MVGLAWWLLCFGRLLGDARCPGRLRIEGGRAEGGLGIARLPRVPEGSIREDEGEDVAGVVAEGRGGLALPMPGGLSEAEMMAMMGGLGGAGGRRAGGRGARKPPPRKKAGSGPGDVFMATLDPEAAVPDRLTEDDCRNLREAVLPLQIEDGADEADEWGLGKHPYQEAQVRFFLSAVFPSTSTWPPPDGLRLWVPWSPGPQKHIAQQQY